MDRPRHAQCHGLSGDAQMRIRIVSLVFVLAAATVTSSGQAPSVRLDPALLGKPPVDAWPTYHGDYSGRRYSTLKQINTSNVKGLTLAWVYRLNTAAANAIVGGEGPDQSPLGPTNPTIKSTP